MKAVLDSCVALKWVLAEADSEQAESGSYARVLS
jgi:hypothetical protein